MTENLLVVDHVSAGYGNVTVLKDIAFDVSEGTVIGVIGPNGHGKTTLLNTISGFIAARRGRIELEGKRIDGRAPHDVAARGIVQIPQGDEIFPGMSVLENLLMGAYLESDPAMAQNRLNAVFGMFPKLKERRTQFANTLSGGERRMLSIGRGLMRESRIILVDEPSLGLAPIIVEEIYTIFHRLKQTGQTMLIVEENPSRLSDLADYIYLIDNGEVAWSGDPTDMATDSDILQTYLGA